MGYRVMKNRVIIGVLISMAAVTAAYAQEGQTPDQTRTISAVVVNEDAQPVPDILVSTANTGNEAVTDSDGNFSLEVTGDDDRIIIAEPGYELKVIVVESGSVAQDSIFLTNLYPVAGNEEVRLPYNNTYTQNRSVSAIYTISGEELTSYPTENLMAALAGRVPGLVVDPGNSMPGNVSVGLTIRGTPVDIYIDGIRRNADDLSAYEVESVQVIKDLSGRAALGVSGAGPLIWVTTKRGQAQSEMNVSAELGINTPTVLPEYLNAYNYARLYNQALVNDGEAPLYDQAALDAYQTNAGGQYPNIDYYDRFVRDYSSFRRFNINFAGTQEGVRYFALLDYTGSSGLEKIGEQLDANRFKLRGNVSFPINDWMDMSVSVVGSYEQQKYPNQDGDNIAFIYDMFSEVLSVYPSNAHPVTYQDRLMISEDYDTNLQNELIYGGYGQTVNINSQNDVNLMIDLSQVAEGLTFKGVASFNIFNNLGMGKGGTEELYRFAGDTLLRVVERDIDTGLDFGSDFQTSSTIFSGQLNYDHVFGDHALTLDGALFSGYYEGGVYQAEKLMDLSLRANYAFDQRYVVQLDLTYSGSMRLPAGRRFTLYPTVGAAWVASNGSFLSNSSVVNYLKFYSSLGIMGINDFFIEGYDPYYLHRTSWELQNDWESGTSTASISTPVIDFEQVANNDIALPERRYFNAGVQSSLFGDKLAIGFNYFREKNTGLVSIKENFTSALLGGGNFLPAVNFEANRKWGFDGMIRYMNNIGDFSYSVGTNALYMRGEHLVVDEPPALAEYRKLAGKDMDLIRVLRADGLFQNQSEIDSRNVSQSWGAVQPGDIRYVDYNGDGIVDEEDFHFTGAHSPRLFYGVNLTLGYKGFSLFVQGTGVADGKVQLNSGRYFKINSPQQNYSTLMLDSWTPQNTDAAFPRMTTSSDNNVQSSTFWLENAAYFRIKNVALSYTLPADFAQEAFNGWKIFIRGKNLFVASGLTDFNVDPANMSAGITGYPMFRTVTVGVAAKF